MVMLNLIAFGIIAIYMQFFDVRFGWDVSRRNELCPRYVKCEVPNGDIYDFCETYTVPICSGSRRCCQDCNIAGTITWNVTIALKDSFELPPKLGGAGILFYLLTYVIYRVAKSKNNIGRTYKITLGGLFFLTHSILVGLFSYVVIYIIGNWSELKKCQTSLLVLLSESFCLLLLFMDFTKFIIKHRLRLLKPLTLCLDFVHKLLSSILVIWWMGLGVYLEGVYRGRWSFYSPRY